MDHPVERKARGSTSSGKKKGKGKQRSARKNFADSDDEAAPAPPRRKFDIRKVRCYNCGLLGHFKADCEEAPKQKALIAQQGDDGDMMLMCKLVDEEDPDSQALTKEIVELAEEKVFQHDRDSGTCVGAHASC